MRFMAKASSLVKELAIVAPLAGKRHTIPILNCVLIRALDGIQLTTTDADSTLRATVHDNTFAVLDPGSLCVEAKRLAGIVGAFKPDAEVRFRAEKDEWLSIECGESRLRIPGMPAQDFPVSPEAPLDGYIEIPSQLLADAIRKTLFASDPDRGMRLSIADKVLTLEATNGNHASIVSRPIEAEGSLSLLVNREVFELLSGLVKDIEATVYIKATEDRIWIAVGERRLICRPLTRAWSDLARMVAHSRKTAADAFKVDRQELLGSVRRAELAAPRQKADKDDGATGIELLAGEGKLTLKAEEQTGQATEALWIDYKGEELEGRFSSIYLRQFLAVCADQIQCRLNKAKEAAVHFLDGAGHEYVLMSRRK